jgi:hypothetical protein
MSERDDDLELQALQRELDDAFQTTRPRRGFEDELWSRMQARRPLWQRLRDALAGLFEGIREAPAVPAAAVAVILIVVVGIGIVSTGGFRVGHSGGSASLSQAAAPAAATGEFGRLPAPALRAGALTPADIAGAPDGTAAGPNQPAGARSAVNVYLGPATLTWTGLVLAPTGPGLVYRYHEPSSTQADQFGISLGAAPSKARAGAGYLGAYEGQGFTVSVRGSVSSPPSEPFYFMTPTVSSAAPGDPQEVAASFLAAHSLVPTWANTVVVVQSGDLARVEYLREFDAPGGGVAYLVDGLGERYGGEVDVQGGRPLRAAGPLPVNVNSAPYRLISGDQAVHAALASSPAGPATLSPPPAVRLDKVELVYALAVSGDQGFYEPGYLFSGSFQHQGVTYVKRVLVPAVDPSQLS